MRPPPVVALALLIGWLALASLASHAPPGRDAPGTTADSAGQPGARVDLRPRPGKAAHPPQATPTTAALTALRDGRPLDLNTATAADLDLLPGIGARIAERIAEARAARPGGRFERTADLLAVSGIGPKKLAAIARAACAGEDCETGDASATSRALAPVTASP